MFGNAPRALWKRWIEPDERNRIPLSCRCMLVEESGGRRVLLEAGIGVFFEPKLKDRFGVQESRHVLLDSLAELGIDHSDIDVVVLSHLHFDHVGGLLTPWVADEPSELLFPNARFVVGARAWERATHPHPRDRASFIPALNEQLDASGRLEIVDRARSEVLGDGYRFHLSDGHTPGLLLTEVETARGPVVFTSDLIPGAPWLHLPITMGYDRFPELLIEEKRRLLEDLIGREGFVFFTHDPTTALARVARDERGRFCADSAESTLKAWG